MCRGVCIYHLGGADAAARAAGCSAACCCSACQGSPLTAEFHHACVTLQASGTAPDGCHAGGAPGSGCGCGGCGGFGRLTFLATPGSPATAALLTAEPRVGGAASAASKLSCGAGERLTTWERAALPLRPSVACSSSGSPPDALPSSVSGISPPRLSAATQQRVAFRAAWRRQRRRAKLRQAPTATPVPSVLPVSAALVEGVTYTATGGKGDGDGSGDGVTACRTGTAPLRVTPASGAGGGCVAGAGGGELFMAAHTLGSATRATDASLGGRGNGFGTRELLGDNTPPQTSHLLPSPQPVGLRAQRSHPAVAAGERRALDGHPGCRGGTNKGPPARQGLQHPVAATQHGPTLLCHPVSGHCSAPHLGWDRAVAAGAGACVLFILADVCHRLQARRHQLPQPRQSLLLQRAVPGRHTRHTGQGAAGRAGCRPLVCQVRLLGLCILLPALTRGDVCVPQPAAAWSLSWCLLRSPLWLLSGHSPSGRTLPWAAPPSWPWPRRLA